MAGYDASSTNKSKRSINNYKDLDLNFTRNPVTNDVTRIEDIDAVKRSVKNLVQTNFYERPFHPELGCGIRELLFENYTPIIGIFLKRKNYDFYFETITFLQYPPYIKLLICSYYEYIK